MTSSFNTLPMSACSVSENDGVKSIEKQPFGSRNLLSFTLFEVALFGISAPKGRS